MIVRLQMDDKLYEVFERRSAQLAARGRGKSATTEEIIIALLDRCQHLNPADRPLVVSSETRTDLELVLNADIPDEKGLLEAAKRVAELEIGGIRVDLTRAQWAHLRNYAARNEISLESMLRDVVARIAQNIFEGGLGWVGAGRIAG